MFGNPTFLSRGGALLLGAALALASRPVAGEGGTPVALEPPPLAEVGARLGRAELGPLLHSFPLTLEEGRGEEALGPLFYHRESTEFSTWGVPPLFSSWKTQDGERSAVFVLPPVFSWRRYGKDERWQLLQWFNGSNQERIQDPELKRFNVFPFWFYQDATDPAQDYWALFPLYGHLKNRMFRDSAEFIAFPAWLKTTKGTMTTYNVAFPFIHWREGPGLRGWQFWPLAGHEHRDPTTRTNVAEELEVVPGHDKTFALWPFYFRNRLGLGTDNPLRADGVIPLYYSERSPKRDHTAVVWPLVSWTDDRDLKYRQFNALWPFVGFARGEGKTLDRVLPFFSVGHTPTFEGQTYLWPLYRRRHLMTEGIDRDRRQYGMFLYVDAVERHKATGQTARRIDSWPFFTWSRDLEGNERCQALALVEPIRRGAMWERNWSPLWSVWRQERNARTGASSQSLLWNLYRRDAVPGRTKGSILFGLVQYERSPEGRRWRWFQRGERLPDPKVVSSETPHVPEHR
ncbi:MAG: hypothetical protein IT580_18280 [Verrucomicrobiales bacterium]|nr:hypothetical protein [Verrucomicrobiales bacterium]